MSGVTPREKATAARGQPSSSVAFPSAPAEVSVGAAFAFLWAMASIVHLLNQTLGDMMMVQWANLLAALFVLGRPSSGHRLALLAVSQVVVVAWVLPFAPDHEVLACLVNLCLLVSYLRHGRPREVNRLVDALAPAARVVLLIAYGGAAAAKYNTDFLDTATSCALHLAGEASFGLVERTGPLGWVVVIGVIASETAVLGLLLWPRTRWFGAVYGACFHFLLSVSPAIGVGDFTVVLWALFLLFLPASYAEAVAGRLASSWGRSPTVALASRVPKTFWAMLVVAAILLANGIGASSWVFLAVWCLTTIGGFGVLFTLLSTTRSTPTEPSRIGRPDRLHWLVLVVVVLLVSSPHLGYGTSSRFTMFSGLRTEGAGTNHLVFPSVHLIGTQSEGLIVLRAQGGSSALEAAANAGAVMPIAEVRRILANPEMGGTFRTLDGRRMVVAPGEGSALRSPHRWWESKTQHYRSYKLAGVTDPGYCSN